MTGALPPGSTLGIIGGGQLGRMTALAAAQLGYRSHIWCQRADEPAAQVAAGTTLAAFDDPTAVDAFAAAIDAATLEFENIPLTAVAALAALRPMRPGVRALEVSQDRRLEKTFIADAGIATAPTAAVTDEASLMAAVATVGTPAVLKTARLGYDGKGQRKIDAPEYALAALREVAGSPDMPCVLEGWVAFACEISVIVARGLDGGCHSYVAVENRHKNHILDVTIAPAAVTPAVAARAKEIAETLAAALDLTGVLAVEMFVTDDDRVLVNEIAPRPHNSGHWTLDACAVSQFEQLVRCACGLPLGDPTRHSDAEMTNLIGDDVAEWPTLMAEPGARVHLYGKADVRPGRKMGHVTRLKALTA